MKITALTLATIATLGLSAAAQTPASGAARPAQPPASAPAAPPRNLPSRPEPPGQPLNIMLELTITGSGAAPVRPRRRPST